MTPLSGTDERWTAAAIAEDVRGRRRTAAEVIDEALDRIAGANGALNAFCEVRPRAARAAAAELDARIAAGEGLALPLAGVPVAVKDVVWEAGVEATDGSRSLLGFIPQEDAIVVQRLTAAGAIVVGRVNAPEFCYRAFCANDLYGVTSNPWDLGRTPGGSSGGSAAAVAAGLVPLAIGTDGGGSIRIPSSFCGVAGFKATFGVSRASRNGRGG
jgi:Asp-tRNA(Asn)/Glu-tRNA(Gln) amidotransferase A subunit family amidase